MFTFVPYKSLEEGKKYKIKTESAEYTGVYNFTLGNHLIFLDTRYINVPTYDIFLDDRSRYYCGNVAFSIYDNFYEFVPQNPRWKMERRTVNLIVRRLLGDIHFEW